MAVEITNPNIIDLAAWQQVVNEINYVSDRVDNLITNYGAGSSGDKEWAGFSTTTHEFNLGTQKIITGRYRFVHTDEEFDGNLFYGPISYGTAFSSKPIITATIEYSNPALPKNPANTNVVLAIYDADTSGFSYRMINAGSSTKLAGTFYINWMAIGPR